MVGNILRNKGRWVAAGLVAAMLGGGAYAYAASLSGLGTNSLGSSDVPVSGCSDTLDVSYTLGPYSDTLHDFTVGTVTISDTTGSGGTCWGKAASVQLTDSTHAGIGGAGTVANIGASSLVTFNPTLAANPVGIGSVLDVAVAVTG